MAPKLALLLLLAAALPAAINACNSCCTVDNVKVTQASKSVKPQESSAYNSRDVQSHFYQVEAFPYVKNTEASFACVDARGDDAYLMTPGGDYAEVRQLHRSSVGDLLCLTAASSSSRVNSSMQLR